MSVIWSSYDQCLGLPASMKVDSLFRITNIKVESVWNVNLGINKTMSQMNITHGS